jgi:arsenate reductase
VTLRPTRSPAPFSDKKGGEQMSAHPGSTHPEPSDGSHAAARLSMVDRFLPVWIAAAMAAGLLLGRLIPGLGSALGSVAIHGTSLPIAIGLLAMMYPVLAKVRYTEIGRITADRRMIASSLILNWIIGPAVMFALAWLLLPGLPAYRTGVILVGLARCIAMVLIWTDLACGDREMAAVLVALNAVFQVLAYAALGVFYLNILPGWLGLPAQSLHVSFTVIAVTVVVFLGIPLVAGFLTRTLGERARGQEWYETRLLPRIAPIALYGLLFTVVVLFALQGKTITSQPLNVVRIALPLLAYFAIMWFGGLLIARRLHLTYARTAALAFSAASNDFELAIAVAIGVFGATSGQALAGVVGPLIEVPVLLGLVYVALWLHRRLTWPDDRQPAVATQARPPAGTGQPVQGEAMTTRPEVLFVCVHNAGRSQMAAALLDHYAAGRVVVRSAGSAPAETINPAVRDVMVEIGLDLSREFPKPLTTEAVHASDVVITMGCGDACPIFPGKRYLNWELDDPVGKDTATVRRIRDEIDTRVRHLLTELLPDAQEPIPSHPGRSR